MCFLRAFKEFIFYLDFMKKKSLAETHPEVSKQWHPTKNGDLTPYDVTK